MVSAEWNSLAECVLNDSCAGSSVQAGAYWGAKYCVCTPARVGKCDAPTKAKVLEEERPEGRTDLVPAKDAFHAA